MTTCDFPVGSRVVLKDLTKAPQYNGKAGVVQSAPNEAGRVKVSVEGEKVMAIRMVNLKLEPRSVESLSVKEMKSILKKKKKSKNVVAGLDKSDLQEMVKELGTTDEENAQILASTVSAKATPPSSFSGEQLKSQAATMANLSPELLRQQAAAMKAMDPNTLRSMNPALANMSDAQIQYAAQQMEMMADNPSMIKMAAQQMQNMTPEELEQQRQALGNNTTSSAPSPFASQAADDPEERKKRADMLRNMDADTLRQMHPSFANMSDAQLKEAAAQMNSMASNPSLMKAAEEQMKNLSPQDVQAIQAGRMPTGASMPPAAASMPGYGRTTASASPGASVPPAAGMTSTAQQPAVDGKQLKQTINMVKDNPELIKQMMGPRTANMSDEQLRQSMESFASMDEKQLERVMNFATKTQKVAQPVQQAWSKVNAMVGGHLLKLLLLILFLFVASRFMKAPAEVVSPLDGDSMMHAKVVYEVESEF